MQAFEHLEQESDFVELIRQNRLVKLALTKLFTATEMAELQQQALKKDLDSSKLAQKARSSKKSRDTSQDISDIPRPNLTSIS